MTTMKQLVFLALFLCISSAAGLKCFTCEDDACSPSPAQMNCASEETLCFSSNISASDDKSKATKIVKGCAPFAVCQSKGTFPFSFNISSATVLGNVFCCDSDNCNTANTPITSPPPPGGSLSCCAGTDRCTSNMTCNALETRCFSSKVKNSTITVQTYGCMSENLCNQVDLSGLFLVNTQHSTTCCNTSNCNAPSVTPPNSAPALSSSLRPLVLLCSLIAFIFKS